MKKIDFKNVVIKDLSCQAIENADVHNIVANSLLSAKGDPIKLYELAFDKVNKRIEFEVDTTDFEIIYKAVENDEKLFTIAKAPILSYLKSLK